MRNLKFSFSILVLLTFFIACDTESESEKVDFDRSAFLANMAENVIEPSIEDFASNAEGLSGATNSFNTNISLESLNVLRSEFKESWLSYQYLAFVHVAIYLTRGALLTRYLIINANVAQYTFCDINIL